MRKDESGEYRRGTLVICIKCMLLPVEWVTSSMSAWDFDFAYLMCTIDVPCPRRVCIVEADDRQIVVLPTSATTTCEGLLADYYQISPKCQVTAYCCTAAIPFAYLSDLHFKLANPPFHPVTPHPVTKDVVMFLPVKVYIDEDERIRRGLPHPVFELPQDIRQHPLNAKICMQISYGLVGASEGAGAVAWEYPPYSVVGSLGMKDGPDKEILLLKACQVSPDHPYHHVELVVHPTHVDKEVGFILSDEAKWRPEIAEKIVEWERDDPSVDCNMKAWCGELVYMNQMVNVRK